MKKKQRDIKAFVVHRQMAGEVIKPEKMRVDVWAVVESRTGVVLRWMYSEQESSRVALRVNAGGPI